ncbi:hypothetical protein Esi_0183_0058 [Ectocarpus siliculosus]|uniref:Uncharacterized protein n=1 Tax=Ectocarpus siliculosus TaxID=2880 RepID=D7FNZ4_ECTSI|nr:hypothetical protein Esi_0183_0058 [Ectocarpus siliculosus]|eukprot:CBJ30263.1 hypothetical protein Esi_0183_0058 [Ectocarpus siliculosus]
MYDDVGTCTCSCGENWRAFNIVGHASCVPWAVFEAFGSVGLALSLVHLVHAAYNLKQQRRCEAMQSDRGMAVRMRVDVYREQLSMITVIHALVIGLYFALGLWLPDESVRWSAVALGVSHILSGIGAVLTVQVLIRSVDPRLLKMDAVILKASAALAHPVGRCLTFSSVSIGAVFLIFLTFIAWTGQGYKIAAIAYIVVTVLRILLIVMCSRSMINIIDGSMARDIASQKAQGAQRGRSVLSGDSTSFKKIKADPKLAAAKRTILSALFFCITLTSIASAFLIFALTTEYGTDNPIVFLALPLAYGPLIALSFHVQLHSKRNKALLRRVPVQNPIATKGEVIGFGSGDGFKKASGSVGTTTSAKSGRNNTTGGRVVPTQGTAEEGGEGGQTPASPAKDPVCEIIGMVQEEEV